jgi:DNA-binding NtrC family response regulator
MPGRQGTLNPMQNSGPLRTPSNGAGFTLVDMPSAPTAPAAQPAMSIVGVSAAWRKLVLQANMAAPHLQVAAIEGESGSGKHTLARYIFSRSPLASTAFQRRDAREWLATDADPSSLTGYTYLDRVDLLAPPGQGLLLGVLKTLQDRPPGRAVVIASSQIPLRHLAAQGQLLPDLAFRLTAIRFAVPPLRQRREDIAPLAQFLLENICRRYQQRPALLGPGTLASLLQHSWPGNVRELASVLETAVLEVGNGIIRPVDLALSDIPHQPIDAQLGKQSGGRPGDLTLDAVIRDHVHYVLDLNHGNKLRAARQLSISRSTLYRILANEKLLAR